MDGATMLKIGQLAEATGESPYTIRYYERVGLLPPPPRTRAGYRMYPVETRERLAFIRKSQALGLTLSEVRDILEITSDGKAPCLHVRSLVTDRLRDVEARLTELSHLRATLQDTLRRLDSDAPRPDGCRCAAIEATPI